MNMLKIVLVIMIIASTLAFTQGCVDTTKNLPDVAQDQPAVVEPSVESTEEAIPEAVAVDDTPAVMLPEREPLVKVVWIMSYAFSPRNPTIYAGDKIKWINDDGRSYKLVSEDGLWENKTIGPKGMFNHTFTQPGVYNYSCPGFGKALQSQVTVVEYNETTAGLYVDPNKKGIVDATK